MSTTTLKIASELPAPSAPEPPIAGAPPAPAEVRQLPGQLITQAALWQLLAISKPTGQRHLARGLIGPQKIKLGSTIRYSQAEVTAWLAHRCPDGSLHDARTWPAVWAVLQSKAKRS